MKSILVSGASGIVGYGILQSLKGQNCKLIGTTIYNESPANCFSDIVEIAPKTSDENYINWLTATIKKHNVDMIIPGIEIDMITWNKHRVEIEKTGTFALLNNSQLIDMCSDKWLFYEVIKNENFAIPTILENDYNSIKQKFGLPFLLKPRKGFAAKGIVKIENEYVFNQHKQRIGEFLIVQPIIGDIEEEYTVSIFFDTKSNILALQQLRRKLAKEGFTEIAQTMELDSIKPVIENLAVIFKPIGPTNFQFRVEQNQIKLLEINPRISSSTTIRTAFGYNESKMTIDYFLNNENIKQPVLRKGKAIRYTADFIKYDSPNF